MWQHQTMLAGEFSGEWWLPTDPGRRKGGFLKLETGKQPRLHLAGILDESEMDSILWVHRDHPVAYGSLADGKPVTLFGLVVTAGRRNLFRPLPGETIFVADRAYVGDHVRHEAKKSFRRMDLTLSYLQLWYPPPVLQRDFPHGRGRPRSATVSWLESASVDVRLPGCRLSFGSEFKTTGDGRLQFGFEQQSSIAGSTRNGRPLDWWLSSVVKPLRYLLAIALERPISVDSIRLRPWTTKRDGEVEIIWANDLPDPSEEAIKPKLTFQFDDIADRFGEALGRWFTAVVELEPIFDQFVATYNTSRSYVETRFTMTVGAAEAYHRERLRRTDVTKAVHQQRVRQARAGVDRVHLEWLNQRLGNEPPLVRRIVELCEQVPHVSKLVLGDAPGSTEAFANRVKAARNLRTHLDLKKKPMVGTIPLVALTSQLALILEAAILHRELGLDEAGLARRFEQSSRLYMTAVAASRLSPL